MGVGERVGVGGGVGENCCRHNWFEVMCLGLVMGGGRERKGWGWGVGEGHKRGWFEHFPL